MKRPTVASLKKVTPENLAALGAERLAEILAEVAGGRPELKRRLRMELAAEQGSEHLAAEVDRRLGTLASSRGKISWRQRPTFVRDLDALRRLIGERLAGLDGPAALARLWSFMDLARGISLRLRDKDGEVAAVFLRAAGDLGRLLAQQAPDIAAAGLAEAFTRHPSGWADWLPAVLEPATEDLARAVLPLALERRGAAPGWATVVRELAYKAGDPDAYRATWTDQALRDPSVAAEVARRLLAVGRVPDAGQVLEAARPKPGARSFIAGRKAAEPDAEWEAAWIDYLDATGQAGDAQAARWAAFERTLSPAPLRSFTARLKDFEDVEAEHRAFDLAARHPDFERGLRFLMEWPALPEAARMIEARADEIAAPAEEAELWASRLRARQPLAAHQLLRKAAAAAFRRRDFATCDRLTQEADALGL